MALSRQRRGVVRNMTVFVRRLYPNGLTLVRETRPDGLIASSTYPLEIWPVRGIARLAAARPLFEVCDLWSRLSTALGGYSRVAPINIAM